MQKSVKMWYEPCQDIKWNIDRSRWLQSFPCIYGGRAGIKSVLFVAPMSPDGTKETGPSRIVYDGHEESSDNSAITVIFIHLVTVKKRKSLELYPLTMCYFIERIQKCTKLFFNHYLMKQKRQSGNWLKDQSSHFASYLLSAFLVFLSEQ